MPEKGWSAAPVEVRRLGLSRVGENTMLTVILNRPAEPRITSSKTSGKPQLVVEFSPARMVGNLPSRLEGDDLLVQQVLSQATPGGGVRLTLDLFPEQPYAFWRQTRPGGGGQTLFILGLRTETPAGTIARMQRPSAAEPESSAAESAPPGAQGPEGEPSPYVTEPTPQGYQQPQPPPAGSAAPGTFAEIQSLMPKSGALLQSLQRDGWTVSESHTYDRPGQRYSKGYTLSNSKYPQLDVQVVYLPANVAGTPNIGIFSLCTDRLGGPDAEKYENLRHWSFQRIKKDYEDIGDFFEDALKPLRVKLREQTKALALRDAAVFQNFITAACGNPQVATKVMGHIREKVNPRFEGVQYTVLENPLVILNQVDFLYVKVYFLSSP